jgi:hypothetical protein
VTPHRGASTGRIFDTRGIAKLALAVQSAHALSMAKTWVSKNDGKSAKVFAKAMKLLSPKNTRRQNSRTR